MKHRLAKYLVLHALCTGSPVWAAIAFDAAASGAVAAATSATVALTVANQPNRMVVVGTSAEDTVAGDCIVSSVTFNGDALAQINSTSAGAATVQCVSLWYLAAPDVATGNVVVTWAGTVDNGVAGAISLYGVKQAAPEANAVGNNLLTTISTSVTTLSGNAWLVDAVGSGNSGGFSATESGQIERFDQAGSSSQAAGSTRLIVNAANSAMAWSQAANRLAHVVAAFAPSEPRRVVLTE